MLKVAPKDTFGETSMAPAKDQLFKLPSWLIFSFGLYGNINDFFMGYEVEGGIAVPANNKFGSSDKIVMEWPDNLRKILGFVYCSDIFSW